MNTDNKGGPRTTIAQLVVTGDGDEVEGTALSGSPSSSRKASGSAWHRPDAIAIQERLRAADMLVPGSQLGPRYADEYRHIKRPLLSNAFGKSASLVDRGNLILVTSSMPGEGKTFTAVNLALSMAQEQDHTVLLVDCDGAKKGASQLLDIGRMPGLMDALESGSVSVGDVLLRSDVPALSVLSAGKEHEYATELLASQRMIGLVNEIVSRYDDRIIIFDGPPVLSTPQTQVLAGLVGQILFVVEAGKTPQSVVEQALEMLPQDKATGLVLNKGEGLTGGGDYYYGYYYSGSRTENNVS